MSALTTDRKTEYMQGFEITLPAGAAKKIYAGSLVALDGVTRMAEAASDAAGKIFVGIACGQTDNSGGAAGSLDVVVRRKGLFRFPIAAATQADVGKPVFVKDDQTVALVGDVTNAIYCGCIARLHSATSVWVEIYPALLQTDVATHVADVSGAHAASAIATAAGGLGIPATAQLALAELYQGLVKSTKGFLPLKLTDFRELAAGVFINAAGNGGILGTDTTPVLSNIGDGDGMRLVWAAGNTDQIEAQVLLPPDMDLTANLIFHAICSKDGNVNAAVHIDGEAYFGEGDADCFPAAGATNLLVQAKGDYTATIAAADLPADLVNRNLTLVVMPEAHANDAVYLHACWLEYRKKLLTT